MAKILLFDPSECAIITPMKYINLSQNKKAKVDDEDFVWLNQWKWCFDGEYAQRGIWDKKTKKVKHQAMARLIMGNPKLLVDHVNGNKLDNRRSNLRIVTRSQNAINKKVRKDSTTGVRGVRYRWQYKLWQARIGKDGKRVSLGHFKTQEEAVEAYQNAVQEWHGEYARTT